MTQDELFEAITYVAFYAGWPKAFSAIGVAKSVSSPADRPALRPHVPLLSV